MRQVRRGEAFFRLLKQRNAPQVYDSRVYNAMINMYAHQKVRGQMLRNHEAAPAWEVFEEMQQRGIAPDEITYNSLISLCARMTKPDVARAIEIRQEMDAVGVPVTEVTLSALSAVYGRANAVPQGREELHALLERGITPSTSA